MNDPALEPNELGDPALKAYHEAGHAVMGVINGFKIKEVRQEYVHWHDNPVTDLLNEIANWDGHYLLSNGRKCDLALDIYGWCEMLQAGYTTMNLHRPAILIGKCVKMSGLKDDETQRALATVLIDDPDEEPKWILRISETTRQVLEKPDNWRAIEALARQLQEVNRIPGKQVEALIQKTICGIDGTEANH